jgi:hypothetical protein
MTKVTTRKTRPIFYTIFICYLLFSDKGIEIDLDLPIESINFIILAIVFLLAAFLFRIRESISIDNETIDFSLHKHQINLPLKSIRAVTPIDVWNVIKIETIDTNLTLNIRNFIGKTIEAFFIENGLYDTSGNEMNKQKI